MAWDEGEWSCPKSAQITLCIENLISQTHSYIYHFNLFTLQVNNNVDRIKLLKII